MPRIRRYAARAASAGEDRSLLAVLRGAEAFDLFRVGYGLLVVAGVALSFLAGALGVLPADPEAMDLDRLLAPPGTEGHPLGTDFLGRDLLSRLILGIRAYFLPGLLAVAVAVGAGAALGLASGWSGGRSERAITALCNLVDSFPRLVLVLLLVAALRPDMVVVMAVVGITNVPAVASLVAGKARLLKERNFIEAAVALGLRRRTILLRHVLWNHCRASLVIRATLGMGASILTHFPTF